MKRNNTRKPVIRALEPRILFDGAAVATAIDVLDNTSFDEKKSVSTDSIHTNNAANSSDATQINDSTFDATASSKSVSIEKGDIFIITKDIPNYKIAVENFSSDFRVIVLEQNSQDILKSNILDATKDLDNSLNIHIITANQNKDKLLVGSYENISDLTTKLTDDSKKLYDLDGLLQQDYVAPSSKGQVIIIDESVSYIQNILDTIPDDWKVITINSQKDGLTQILEKLDGISDLSSIHIFSHGNSGEIILGNLVLNSKTIGQRTSDLAKLGSHLNETGDILLYGCDVSSGYIGQEFVNLLAEITNADIAASDDATGSFISSANFNLETKIGNIESSVLEVNTNGQVLGNISNYTFNIDKDGPRLKYQASGNAAYGWWNQTNNNWVDYYTDNREVSYSGVKWVEVNALFFKFSFPLPWVYYYSYGTGVRYGVQEFTVSHDSKFQITANSNNATKNQLGSDKTEDVLNENYSLYKVDENGVGFDKYNPLKNLVTASEGLLGGMIYLGELKAGKYQVVASFDTWRWFNDVVSLMTLNQYAEQFFEPVSLRVENLNSAPVWGSIADQTISGSGEKSIKVTTWDNVKDADGDNTTVSAVILNSGAEQTLPSWLKFNPNTLTFNGNPPANTGTLNIRLKAFDGQEYGYKDFKLTFTNDNDQPILVNEIQDVTWDGQGNFEYQIPTNTFADSDPVTNTFKYTATLADGSALPKWLTISNSGLISGNPPADYKSLTIVVTANDGSGQNNATQTDTFVLNLKNNNDIPKVLDNTITLDEDTTYKFQLTDFQYTDTDTHSYNDSSSGKGKDIQSIRIVELPQNGTLWIDSNNNGVLNEGEEVQLNQIILTSDISKLKYTPNKDWAGHNGLPMVSALKNGPDSFKWISNDDYNDSSNTATTTLNVKLVNDNPTLSFSEGKSLNIRPSGGSPLTPVYVDQGLNLTDVDALYSDDVLFDTIFGISVTIIDSTTNKFVVGDKLSLTGNTSGFTVAYDSVNGILTIEKEGGARASEYQALLRTLQFSSDNTTNNNLRTLGLSFRIQDVGSKTSAYFDGVDDYLETLNASIPTTGDFTISAWAKLDNPSSLANEQYTIFGQGVAGNNIFLQVVKIDNATYKLRIGDAWEISGADISSILKDGKWHQYTITRSGSGTSDGSLYIDGKYIESGDINTTIIAGNGLRIGRLYDKTLNSSEDYDQYWKGSIFDVRVYNKVLSSVAIQQSLSNQLSGNESGLKAWYKLQNDYINYAVNDGGNAVVFKDANYGYSIKTGHYYKLDTTSRDYSNATSNAQNSNYAGEKGYLVRMDDALSSSELEVVKLMNSLYGSTLTWIGAERVLGSGNSWYWSAGNDANVYFNHGSNEGLDNNPIAPSERTIYEWSGTFGKGDNTKNTAVDINYLETQVTFNYYSWDSWDKEDYFIVKLNDKELFKIYREYTKPNTTVKTGTISINGYNISYRIEPNSGNYDIDYGKNYWDQTFAITIDIPKGFSNSIKLSFIANTDQDKSDEAAEINNLKITTKNPEYYMDKAFIKADGYIDNQQPSSTYWSLIEYGNKGKILSAPSMFVTSYTALPDKYVNETRNITVRETNNAPSSTASWNTASIDEDSSYKFKASDFTSKFSDKDGDTLSKIKITSIPNSSQGTLILNGMILSNNDEIPTGDLDKLVFTPKENFYGNVTFKYQGSDGYLYTNESTVTIVIKPVNDAPVLTSNQTLTSIDEDILDINNIGQTVASFITDGTITDVDGVAYKAIAITSVDNSYGTWQYRLENGSWTNISNISGAKINLGSSALLLDSNSLLRFIPNENFYATSTFEFRAWDKSSGVVGGVTDPYKLGGNSSLSVEIKTSTITINPINDVPTTENKTLEINEDEEYKFTLNDFKFIDVDTTDSLVSIKIETLPTLGVIKLDGVAISSNSVITKVDIEAGKLTYITAHDGFGTAYSSFNFSVSDGIANSAPATIAFDTNDTNDAPTDIFWKSGGSVAENSEGGVVVGQLDATDPNTGDTLRFVRIENSKFIVSTTGLVTVAKDAYLDFERTPIQTIKVKVIDSEGLSYIKELTINILDVIENDPKIYTNNIYAEKNTIKTLTLDELKTADADTSDDKLVYTVKQAVIGGILFVDTNNNGTYEEGIDTLLGPESEEAPEYKENFTQQDIIAGKIKFLKDETQTNSKITLSVSDGNSKDDGMLVIIVSNPPVLTAPIDDQEWKTTGNQSFTIPSGTFTDADFDILTYSANLVDGLALPSWLSFDTKTGKFSGTPVGLNDGDTISIKVTATDGRTTPASDTFIITFKGILTKPAITKPLPEYIEFIGAGEKSYTIPENTFSDPKNGTLTYSATLADGQALPSWLSFDSVTKTFKGNPPASASSEPLILKIVASNGTDSTATTIKLYVSDSNDIPVNSATISDKVINDANTHTYTISKGTYSDGDNDDITLLLTTQDGSELPSWVTYETNSAGDLIITAKAPAGSGVQNLRVIGSDGNGGDAVSNFKITYSGGVNESPQVRTSEGLFYIKDGKLVSTSVGALEKFSILAGKTSTITTSYLTENDSDDDGIGLTYTIVNDPLYGQLWIDVDGNGIMNGTEKTLSSGDTFTQKDIDDKKLKYTHTAQNSLDDRFVFNLADGGENGSVELKNVTFNIDVLENPTDFSIISVKRFTPIDTLTNEDEIQFKVKFSSVAYGVDINDFEVTGVGSSGATISKVQNMGSNEYMITVSNITSNNGEIGIALKSDGTIITTGGTAIDKIFIPTINEKYTLDNINPEVTITADRTIYAGTTPFKATLKFSEKITNLTLDDIGVTNATVSNIVQIDDFTFVVDVTPTGTENIALSFESAKVNDLAGNSNNAATQITITKNILPTLTVSASDLNVTFIEIDGVDNHTNDVLLFDKVTLADTDLNQDLQSFIISIPTASIFDGAKEKLIIGNQEIPLNFVNGKYIPNIIINGVEYKVKAVLIGVNSTLVFEKVSGKMSLNEAKDLLKIIKYNNSSDTPNMTNRVFSLVINDGLENSNAVNITVKVIATNDTPTITKEVGDSDSANLTETNSTLNTSGTLTAVDLDGDGLSVNDNNSSDNNSNTVPNKIGNDLVEKPTSGNEASSSNAPTIFDPGSILKVPNITSYVEIPSADELKLQNQTISIWLKPEANQDNYQPIIAKVDPAGGGLTRNFSIWLNSESKVHYSISTANGENKFYTVGNALTLGEWNQITVTYDSSHMRIYLNGVQLLEVAETGTTYKGNQSLYIGGLPTPETHLKAFVGDIADVRIYNKALSQSEIQSSMTTQLTGSEANLVYYTRFDKDANGNIVDLTATNNIGTIKGNASVIGQVTINEDSSHTFKSSEFSTNYLYKDPNDNAFKGIKVINLPTNGTLKLNGVDVTKDQIILSSDISKLVYKSNDNYFGIDRFYFKAVDSTNETSNTEAFNISIVAINDIPTAKDKTILIDKNVSTILNVNDFSYNDVDNDVMSGLQIIALPTKGSLEYFNGTSWNTVTLNQTISKTDIDANKLRFTPISNESGVAYANFKFRVSDGKSYSSEHTITYTVNSNDTSVVSIESVKSSGTIDGLSSNNSELFKMLSLTSNENKINWNFNSASEYFDYLAQGETLTLTYTIKVADSSDPAKFNTKDIVINIVGTNDAPVVSTEVTSIDNSNESSVNAGGKITITDVDANGSTQPTINVGNAVVDATRNGGSAFTLNQSTIDALNGALTINSDGTYSYNMDSTKLKDSSDNLIANGDKINVKYTITISDGEGGTTTKDLTFTFIGTGTGAKLVVSDGIGSIIEGSKLSDSGSLTQDSGANITSATISLRTIKSVSGITLTSEQEKVIKNAFSIDKTTKSVNWKYSISEENIDFLPQDSTITAEFKITIDGIEKIVTITITGTNDAPVITSTIENARGSVTEAGDGVSGTATTTGTLSASDKDSGDTLNWSLDKTSGTYGNILIVNGVWTYTLDNTKAATQALKSGDKVVETFIATVSDGKGGTSSQTITIEVNGSNDAPTFSNTAPTITYNGSTVDENSLTGNIGATDDTGNHIVYSIDGQVEDNSDPDFTHSKTGDYGTLYINENTGAYKFVPNSDAINGADSTVFEEFKFNATNDLGISNSQSLTINIIGTNDAPVISIGSNDSAGKTIYETNTTLSTNGTLSVMDFDKNQTVSVSLDSVNVTGNKNSISDDIFKNMLNITSSNGVINWVFNSGTQYFDYLSSNETLILTYTIKASDSYTPALETTQAITITIKGTNDAPKITVESGDSTSESLTETNSSLNTSGTLTINEVEPNDTVNASIESVSINSNSTVNSSIIPSNAILKAMLSLDKSTLLSDNSLLNDKLTWNFNSGNEYFDKMASGETLILDYVIKVSDSANPSKIDTKIVTITITGENDTPVINNYVSNDINVNGEIESGKPLKLSDKGTIIFSDVDFSDRPTATKDYISYEANRKNGDAFTLTPTQLANIQNGFSISSNENNKNNGSINWEYTISQANIDFLGSGEYIDAIFKITVSDGNGGIDTQDIKIRLTGENKTPTLTLSTKDIDETDSTIDTAIQMTAKDPNVSDILTVSVLSGTYQLSGKAIENMTTEQLSWLKLNTATYTNEVVPNGTPFDLTFNTSGETFDWLNSGETVKLIYTVEVIDDAPIPSSSTKTVTITITGTNDTPIAVVDIVEIYENESITIDVLANDTDKDSLDNSSNFILKSVNITTNNHSSGYDASKVTNLATAVIVDNKLVFTPNDEFDYLAQGETAEVIVTYTMIDDEGVISTSTAKITIKGTNDTPVIEVLSADKAKEDFVESINPIITSGTLSVSDKDTSDIVTASIDSVTILGDSKVGNLTNDYFKSMLTLKDTDILDSTKNNGIITWNFNSGSDIFDYIAKDEKLILTYTIKVTDSSGGFATQEVVIEILGTNDAPVLNPILSKTYIDTSLNDVFDDYIGNLIVSDSDLTDTHIYSITEQIADTSESGFTHSKLGNYGKLFINENTGEYKYIPNNAKIQELTTTMTDEFIFHVIDNSGEVNNRDSKTFVVTLEGTNDTPRVLNDNIDTKTSFGEEFKQETSYLFFDIDKTDTFIFEALKLPLGLSIDKYTGVISGRAVESGIFDIIIKVTDSGNPALSVQRTFNLLVIAPAQNSGVDFISSTNHSNDFAQKIIQEITVDRVNESINSFRTNNNILEVLGNKNSIDELLNINNSLSGVISLKGTNLDISATELTSFIQTNSNNPNDKIITANANLDLDSSGKVNYNDRSNKAFQAVGLTIEKINLVQNQIEIKILDTRVGQKYSVTLIDGNPLPKGLFFDPNTGKITGVLPEGIEELNISIKALSSDGTTRVLNIKIDLKALKQKQNSFSTLSQQVEKQSFKMSEYGNYINLLINKNIAV